MLQAREWLRGNWPLDAVWDMHPVGAPALFAAIMGLLGEQIWVPRLLGLLGTWLTAWALYAMVRFATALPAIGLAAGLLYLAHTTLLGGLQLCEGTCLGGAQTLLIVPHPIGALRRS